MARIGRGEVPEGRASNEKVLRQIFEWAQVGHESKALKVRHPKADARGGMYLQFRPNDDEAWLGIGPDSPKTKFDSPPANPDKLDPSKARVCIPLPGLEPSRQR